MMFEVFNDILSILKEIRDASVKMERHLYDLTLPPDMKEWAEKIREENIDFLKEKVNKK